MRTAGPVKSGSERQGIIFCPEFHSASQVAGKAVPFTAGAWRNLDKKLFCYPRFSGRFRIRDFCIFGGNFGRLIFYGPVGSKVPVGLEGKETQPGNSKEN